MTVADLKHIPVKRISLPSLKASDSSYGNEPFKDNIEHLEALEYLSRFRLTRAFILGGKSFGQSSKTADIEEFQKTEGAFPDIPAGKLTLDEIEILSKRLETEIRQKVEKSLEQGIKLHFEEFCQSYNLDQVERNVLALLVANNTGKAFRNFYEKSEFDPHAREDGGMSIGAILSILHPNYREQITSRQYFSVDASLIQQEIVIPWGHYDNTTNILDVYVHLHERIVRYLTGDNNIYDMSFHCISRDRDSVNFDQVILSEGIKEKVLKLARNYSANKSRTSKALVDQFYGYGTGLVFLFHGPSGTGKTMLAHALATSLNMELLSVNMEGSGNQWASASSEDLIKYLFKEAKLSDGIVFFDECDEVFYANTRDSRNLLIELEKSDCITILASNRVIEMDPALDRRITMKIPFFLPDENQREKIWKALVPPNVTLEKDVNFKSISERYVFSGGLIKNAMLTAITNAMSGNGQSRVRINAGDIEETAKWQTASMFDLNSIGKSYLPEGSINSLPIGSSDKRKVEIVSNACIHNNDRTTGLRILLGCSNVQTGIEVAAAIAAECKIRIREFNLDNLLLGPETNQKIIDPMTRQEIDLLSYIFRTETGYRSMILLVDHTNLFETLLLDETDEKISNYTVRFHWKLRCFKGLLFLVTNQVKTHSLPLEFSSYLEIRPPSEELQIRKWEEYLGKGKDTEQQLVELVEQYPLHLKEISEIIQNAKTTALLNGNNAISLEDVHETLNRLKGRKSVKILFGRGADHG
jgi:DNA polymerase III delta prime subunit